MDQPQSLQSEEPIGESLSSIEEKVREEVERIRRLMAEGDSKSALALLEQLHPVDQGEVLVGLAPELMLELLADLPTRQTADILDHLPPEEAVEIAEGILAQKLPQILDETRPEVAADILRHLPQEQSQETLEAMAEAAVVTPLLAYADETAGGLMTPEYPVVLDHVTAGMALDTLRLMGQDAEEFTTIFVIDREDKLLGSLSIARLALARPDMLVTDIAHPEVISVTDETDQEQCARLMERYNLVHLPVIDDEQRLIGIIRLGDVVDVVEEEATEDMYRIAGIAGERVTGPWINSVRLRLPWLYINLGTAFLGALVISFFESTIDKVAALAVFLPVVAGQGGIGGTQTLTLIVRSMALGETTGRSGLHLMAREVLLGLIHGLLLAVGVGLIGYLWKGNAILGVVVGVAMLGNMVVAGLAGSGVPLLLRRLNLDPAVSSAIFVTTFTDVLGFLLFLGLAAALVDSLT